MDSMQMIRPKRGRPHSGKKGFLVRMPPSVYDFLRKSARDDGYEHMGDWFTEFSCVNSGQNRVSSEAGQGKLVLQQRFALLARQATRLTEELLELADLDLTFALDNQACAELKKLEACNRKLMALFRHELPNKFEKATSQSSPLLRVKGEDRTPAKRVSERG